jgi:dipeptidyl aminopeptidase/acylaminoacyl peptidase
VRLLALLGVVATGLALHGSHSDAAPCNRNDAWQDRFPAWSPNGDQIAFVRQLPGCSLPPEAIGIVEPGRAASIIERDARRGSTAPPSWSPTGAKLAFGTSRDTIRTRGEGPAPADIASGAFPSWGGSEIAYTIENEVRIVGASPRTVLSDYLKPTQSNGIAAWSPDGSKLALGVQVNTNEGGIAVVDADGTNVHLVGRGLNQSVNPTWSPDGRKIAFETNRDGTFDIYSVNADGTGLRNLTNSASANDRLPAWYDDTIAFISDRALSAMRSDGSNMQRLARDAHPYSAPSWSPDGTKIAFASGRECLRWGIYVFDMTTGGTERLTNRCKFEGTPHDDVIRGTAFLDFIDGGPGDDRLYGRDGNDHITTGGGHDHVFGGPGNDLIRSASGSRDVVSCGSGRDSVVADRADHVLRDCERVRFRNRGPG